MYNVAFQEYIYKENWNLRSIISTRDNFYSSSRASGIVFDSKVLRILESIR